MTFQALVALAIFAVGALAVTSLSIRQLVATRHAARAAAHQAVVEQTMAELEASPYSLSNGQSGLSDRTLDGVTVHRELQVSPEEGGKVLRLTLTSWVKDEQGRRIGPEARHEKVVLRL
jgi:hypothetical protein